MLGDGKRGGKKVEEKEIYNIYFIINDLFNSFVGYIYIYI